MTKGTNKFYIKNVDLNIKVRGFIKSCKISRLGDLIGYYRTVYGK